jgi:hypothetical protein
LSLKKRLFFTAIITLPVMLAAFAIAELYVRRTSKMGYVTPEILKSRSLQYIPSLFSTHVFPRKDLRAYGGEGKHGSIYYHINEKGYRGHDFELKKPPGAIRIIFYGGSHVFDIWESDEDDWPHQVERMLRSSGFPQVEVINAGIPGHASFDSFGRLWSEGHVFSPDYVVFCNAWNDMRKHFRSNEPLLRQVQPYIEDSDPRLNYRGGLDRILCEHSQLYCSLRQRYYDWKLRADPEGITPQRDAAVGAEIPEEALAQYKLNAELFVDCARNIGAVPILMMEARRIVRDARTQNAGGGNSSQTNPTSGSEAVLGAYENIEGTLRAVSKEKKTALIEDSQSLNGNYEFFVDHVHLTEEGSAQLARVVAQDLAALLKERY